jgi:hypothetical protein
VTAHEAVADGDIGAFAEVDENATEFGDSYKKEPEGMPKKEKNPLTTAVPVRTRGREAKLRVRVLHGLLIM